MDHIASYLAGFRTIDLENLNQIKLMKRYDQKFTFHKDQLPMVFDYLSRNHQVLELGDHRVFTYDNLYFDTHDRLFYRQHHDRRVNRYKLRCRKYLETGQCFFEIKFKNNKKKTIKTRLLLGDANISDELSEESKTFARNAGSMLGGTIVDTVDPSLWIRFNRITFANLASQERLTFDMNLTYTDMRSNSQKIDNLIIAELKSEGASMNSPFSQYLKDIKIFPSKFSKYCMGLAIMEEDIKQNRFKKKILKLKNLM